MNTYSININRVNIYKRITENDLLRLMNEVRAYCMTYHKSAQIYNNKSHACVANFNIDETCWEINNRSKFREVLWMSTRILRKKKTS
jgi:hypothetical protein